MAHVSSETSPEILEKCSTWNILLVRLCTHIYVHILMETSVVSSSYVRSCLRMLLRTNAFYSWNIEPSGYSRAHFSSSYGMPEGIP